ncbi:hypothetical protein GLOTRDRAFT_110130 [Gloeophyllum trabeum ATCC 11539]|uniref:Uncharacterized protein n=1 Tax=Gloeophyllum trabeum (strain ATCC 11539 / FP-39264 / Madison 617) TaxID=670483 RepID=S7RUB6_GLOTA|nr:uncharacterized protein GLOTRDRAFT_110130 [Gloeophyllum trabeum ATCC 11539]EPQ58320.1 hypothetical protein GLOTRDRAFT_110130 [Gloeophyllum trabeum ATCC 11539]
MLVYTGPPFHQRLQGGSRVYRRARPTKVPKSSIKRGSLLLSRPSYYFSSLAFSGEKPRTSPEKWTCHLTQSSLFGTYPSWIVPPLCPLR